MSKVLTVFGTRPEAIKLAPVVTALAATEGLTSLTAVTGQHREMLDQVNQLFEIAPDFDLNIFEPGQSLTEICHRAVSGLIPLLLRVKPDILVIQGDTNTAFAAALAAFYHEISVVHVEAGLRSGSLISPFPEEGNRRLTSQIASLHLAPTELNRTNLLNEGIPPEAIVVTGNTVIDSLLATTCRDVPVINPTVKELLLAARRRVLVTMHRRENQGRVMSQIGHAIADLARQNADVDFIIPVHRNPKVRHALIPPVERLENVHVLEPLMYSDFTNLLAASYLVLSDSGGLQEEAPALGVPVLVIRDTTERPEAIRAGTAKLVGTSRPRIVREATALLNDRSAYTQMANAINPYGDGKAAERSVAAICSLVGLGDRLPDFQAAV